MGRSKKVFGNSQQRRNGDIRSLFNKKKRTAEAALDALGAKLAARKAQKAIDDKELARREDGAGNTYLLGIMMQENPKKALLDKIRLRNEEAAMLKRTLPARIIPMPPAEEMDTSPEPLRPPAQATYAVATKVLPRRPRIDWRRKHPREMAQAILYVHNFGGGAENVTKALAALQDDAVLNVDGIFDKLTRGTYTRWIKDWDDYIGSIDDFCKPSGPVLSHQHQSPVYDSTKTKMKELPDDQKKPWQEEKQKLLDAHRQAVRDCKEGVARIHRLREEVAQLKAANAELRGEDDDVSDDSSSESSPGSDAESSDSEDEDEDEDEVMEVVDSTAGDAGGSEAGGVSPAHLAGAPAILSDDVAAPAEQAITNAPAPKAWKSRVPPRVYGTRSKKTPGPI